MTKGRRSIARLSFLVAAAVVAVAATTYVVTSRNDRKPRNTTRRAQVAEELRRETQHIDPARFDLDRVSLLFSIKTRAEDVNLWSVPLRSGGLCTVIDVVAIQFSDLPNLSTGTYGTRPPKNEIVQHAQVLRVRGETLVLLDGRAGAGIRAVRVRSGRAQTNVPVRRGFFMGILPHGGATTIDSTIEGIDGRGRTVATRAIHLAPLTP